MIQKQNGKEIVQNGSGKEENEKSEKSAENKIEKKSRKIGFLHQRYLLEVMATVSCEGIYAVPDRAIFKNWTTRVVRMI